MSSSCNAGHHKRGARPTKKQRTSLEQRCSEASSAEQPVVDGPTQGTFCVITHAATLRQHSDIDVHLDMRAALRCAMKEKPDAIIVCLSRVGATAEKTFLFMQMLCKVLESMERQGKAPTIKQRNSVVGVICHLLQSGCSQARGYGSRGGIPGNASIAWLPDGGGCVLA